MDDTPAIRERMEVIGADGGHVGIVDGIESDRIRLALDGAEDEPHYISVLLVNAVEANAVRLSFKAEMAPRFWEF